MHDCLIVVGMHRSGTSALTGALHRMGVAIGNDVAEASDDDVSGYYEHNSVLEAHEQLLAACGSAWDDIAMRSWQPDPSNKAKVAFQASLQAILKRDFLGSPLWTVKDPRLCRLLPLWLPVLAELEVRPHVILAYRRAEEVAASLGRRNGFSKDKATLLWVDHALSSERASRGCRRSFVGFADLLEDPVRVLDRVGRQLDLEWPVAPSDRAEELRRFLDPRRRHNHVSPSPTPGRATELAKEVESALAAAAAEPLEAALFDALRSRQQEMLSVVDPLLSEHLHEFSRRETAASVWQVKDRLQAELTATSLRLGDGISRLEVALADIVDAQETLASSLTVANAEAEARSAEIDRTLRHLTDVAANLREAVVDQQAGIADIQARFDRLDGDIQLEARLLSMQEGLDHLSHRLDALAAARTNWRRRLASLFFFWRPKSGRGETAAS